MSSTFDGRHLRFSRNPATGEVKIWPEREGDPHIVGSAEAFSPVLSITPNHINASVQMVQMVRSFAAWAGAQRVAVVGEVAAGRYDVTVAYHHGPDAEEVLDLPAEVVRPGCFALRVRGDSMQDAGIQDGDYVLVRPQPSAEDGDLVIAGLVDAEDPEGYVTLKQYRWEGDHVRLQPANNSMAPIHLYPQQGKDSVEVQGRVVAVIRVKDD